MVKQLVPFAFLIFAGCSKADNDLLSSDKTISSVSFKMSDNSGLSSDVTGIVSSDNIKFELPQQISINNLIPSIVCTGKKIEPENNTAQDFTNGVTYKVTAEDGSTKNYFIHVTQIASDTATLILGTWKLLKDSVTNNSWISPTGGYLIPGVYFGTSLDYWKFEPNGVFSARENNGTGTDTYTITPDKKLNIAVWTALYGPGTIETIDNSTLTVFFSATSVNGGQYFRKVYLKR